MNFLFQIQEFFRNSVDNFPQKSIYLSIVEVCRKKFQVSRNLLSSVVKGVFVIWLFLFSGFLQDSSAGDNQYLLSGPFLSTGEKPEWIDIPFFVDGKFMYFSGEAFDKKDWIAGLNKAREKVIQLIVDTIYSKTKINMSKSEGVKVKKKIKGMIKKFLQPEECYIDTVYDKELKGHYCYVLYTLTKEDYKRLLKKTKELFPGKMRKK